MSHYRKMENTVTQIVRGRENNQENIGGNHFWLFDSQTRRNAIFQGPRNGLTPNRKNEIF